MVIAYCAVCKLAFEDGFITEDGLFICYNCMPKSAMPAVSEIEDDGECYRNYVGRNNA